MRRRAFITLIGGAVAWLRMAQAQQMPVIGYLSSASPQGFATRLAAFRQGLQEIGYHEGQNVAIEYRWAEGQNERLPALAADLVGRRVAVIATPSSPNAARAAKAATDTIPIVFEVGSDPVAIGLVNSLSRPNGNVTGVTSLNVEVGQKRLELLRELLPRATVIAALVNPTNVNAETVTTDLRKAAHNLGIAVHILHVSGEHEVDVAFTKLADLSSNALVMTPDPFFIVISQRLIDFALRRRLPTLVFSRDIAAAGALLSYGGSVAESHRQAGIYTGRILKGEKPADLPVQQITKFELAINMKTARALNLDVPPMLLARADEVFE
jgi:putative ABC transport system substrate-binding protein